MNKTKYEQLMDEFLDDLDELETSEQETEDLHSLHDETGLEFDDGFRRAA